MQWFVDGRKNYKGPQVEILGESMLEEPQFQNGYTDQDAANLKGYRAGGELEERVK